MKNTFYNITYFLIQNVLRLYFRKIYYTNEERVPKGLPKMYALNHPTSFIEPILLATHSDTIFNFILRGDVYNSPKIVQWILRSHNCIPIYRKSEGFEGMRKNQTTFDFCYDLWKEGKDIQVLVEGQTKHEKRLRRVAKGPARMVLGFYEKYKQDHFAIIPVGINYTDPHQFRSSVMVDFGEPIYLKDYLEAYKKNDRIAVRKITEEIQKRLRERVIHVENPDDDELVYHLLEISRNTDERPIFPIVDRENEKPLKEEFRLTEKINNLDESAKKTLKEKTFNYLNELKINNLKDFSIPKSGAGNFLNFLLLVLGFAPYLVGHIFHFIPLWAGRKVADKVAKMIEFHASIRVGVWSYGSLLYYFLWLITLLIIGNWWLVGALFLMPIFARFAVIYRDLLTEFIQARRFKGLNKNVQNELISQRAEILKSVA